MLVTHGVVEQVLADLDHPAGTAGGNQRTVEALVRLVIGGIELFLAAGPLEAAITDRALGVEVTPEQSAFVGYGSQERLMAVIGQTLAAASPWLLGERFSAADVYLGSQILFGLKFKTIAPQQAFQAYLQRLMARPAWQRATAADDALLPA